MGDILYTSGPGLHTGQSLYVNLTNQCPCSCSFCIRSAADAIGSARSLWHQQEPTLAQVKEALEKVNLKDYAEVVFCGYGEPFCALDVLLATCRYLRANSNIKIRINTNGLGGLIAGRPVAPLLRGLVDSVSISLNTDTAEKYNALCHPTYGLQAYPAILQFARECKEVVPQVVFTVVDVITPEEIVNCKQIAAQVGIPLRVRHYA